MTIGVPDEGETTRVLVLCTANQCRSPLTAAALSHELAARALPVEVTSAGLGTEGAPATSATVRAAAALGLDLASHRSRRIDAMLVRDADLVIGMERLHVREATILDPSAFGRVFTLKELVRRGETVGPRGSEPLATWLARVHSGRKTADLLGASPDDDVADPTTSRIVDHSMMADEVHSMTARLATLVWGKPG